MSDNRWQRVEDIFHRALELAPGARSAFLDEACAADQSLRREVESLLAYESEDGATFAGPAGHDGPLTSGQQLGPYVIGALLGAGGMGEVYRAVDTRLGRHVAIKVSAQQYTERFEREARAISGLNHPHICTLYDVGPNYLVMELVEGETLAARLKKGKLSIGDTLRFGEQIAAALAEAHSKKITHRDLKPGNVMIGKNGVKVLDFGLAKSAKDETLTGAHAVMGTPAYMSLEQAEGNECDARSDIYSLGVVLHEMATGKRPAEDKSAALRSLPPRLAHVIGRCLEQDPENRWQTARDVTAELEWSREPEPATTQARPGRRWQWFAAAALVTVALVVTWIALQFRPSRHAEPLAFRLQLQPPDGSEFIIGGTAGGIALSPDGKSAAYVVQQQGKTGLWIRPLDGTTARLLPGTEDATFPFWSPDNRSVAFFAGSKLLRSDLAGGPPVQICDVPSARGGAWSDDGRIIVASTLTGLLQVPESGGAPAPLTNLDSSRGENAHAWPEALPGGRFLYLILSQKPENAGVFVASFARPSERRRLIATAANALFAPGGDGKNHLLWLRGNALVAQEFDLSALKLGGEPRLVADSVSTLNAIGRMNVAVSTGGVLLYDASTNLIRLTWLDRSGRRLGEVGELGPYINFRISPDGSRVAVARDNDTQGNDLWLLEVERDVSSRFTSNPFASIFPLWSPDSRTIVFTGGLPQRLIRKPVSAGTQQSLTPPQTPQTPQDWSRDGRLVLYSRIGQDTQQDLWYLPVTPEGTPSGEPKLYLGTRFNEWFARFSPEPDPRWVAYESDESGQLEVYIQAFPEPRGARRISTAGGRYPQFGASGRELFYLSPDDKLMVVDLKIKADSVEPSVPRELFPVPPSRSRLRVPYDAAPDGRRFLVRTPAQKGPQPLTVIVNWPALLKSGAPAP